MVIKVPSSYAKKSILYINTQNNHVVYQEVSDEKEYLKNTVLNH